MRGLLRIVSGEMPDRLSSVVLLFGRDVDDDAPVTVAADFRMVAELGPGDVVEYEGWQVVSR